MSSARIAVRSARAVRVAKYTLRQQRFQSSSSAPSQSHGTTALYGGLAGGAFAAIVGYTWYSFSGVKTAVSTAQQAKAYIDSGKQRLQQAAPEPNEALDWLRKQASFYASFVPGGKQYVDGALNDLDSIRQKHGKEVDKIVKDAYQELKDVSNKDLSVSTANEAWQVLQKYVKQITDLASDAGQEIISNHPQLKSAIGSNVEQLRSLGDKLGPDANKLVTDTWSQVKDLVVGGGVSAATISKVKQLIEEKTEQVKKMGESAWSKGYDELKPYLEKNPQVKELLDNNKAQLLSSGTELWSKVKEASQSGNVEDLQKFVKQVSDKAKQSSGGIQSSIESYIDGIFPGGKELVPKLNEFKELAGKVDTKGLEKLANETANEIKELLEKKLNEGKKLIEDGEKEKK